MNFGYPGKEEKEIIKNYAKTNDKIIINFLNGSKCEIPLTDESEIELLKQMLEQAKERDKKVDIDFIKSQKDMALKILFFETLFTMTNAVSYCYNDSKVWKGWALVIGCITGVYAVIGGMNYKVYSSELNELKKYRLYLSLKEKIDNTNPNLFNGIKKRELNINTLDTFTLKELRVLNENLTKEKQVKKDSSILIKKRNNK